MDLVRLGSAETEGLDRSGVLAELISEMEKEAVRLTPFYDEYNFNGPKPPSPRNASEEQKRLASMARTPLLRLIVEATVEPMKVEGYRPSSEFSRDEEEHYVPFAWRCWTLNDLTSRQATVHRDAAIAGYSYLTVVPGEGPDGEPIPTMRPVSPRRCYAEYDDPYGDEFPIHAVQDLGRGRYRFFDAESIVTFERVESSDANGGTQVSYRQVDRVDHDGGVCPVVRFENMIDSEGRCVGEVEPYMEMARRFDVTQNDKLMVQRFNSWKIMWATGLTPPKDVTEEEQRRTKVRMRQEDMILAGPDVKFGQLDETSLGGFLTALNDELELLSSVSQTPVSVLSGNLVNLSADALAEARIMHTLKLMQRMTSLGAEWCRALRLACAMAGETEEAKDYQSTVVWAEVEVRSLAQTVDAFGKLAAQLEVPPMGLWEKVPGVTASDVARWKTLRERKREEDLAIEAILADIEAGAEGGMDSAGVVGRMAPTNVAEPVERMASYEHMDKPWQRAARGGARSTQSVLRMKRKQNVDGDGDGIIGE